MPMSVKWNPSYTVSHVVLDAQHQMWFEYAHAFFNATSKDMQTLRAIQFYQLTREHFAYEDQLMLETHYPDCNIHALKHQAVMSSINDISDGLTEGSLNLAQAHAFVVQWMTKHIEVEDSAFAAYLKQYQETHSSGPSEIR